jgi:hypothetical protein
VRGHRKFGENPIKIDEISAFRAFPELDGKRGPRDDLRHLRFFHFIWFLTTFDIFMVIKL